MTIRFRRWNRKIERFEDVVTVALTGWQVANIRVELSQSGKETSDDIYFHADKIEVVEDNRDKLAAADALLT